MDNYIVFEVAYVLNRSPRSIEILECSIMTNEDYIKTIFDNNDETFKFINKTDSDNRLYIKIPVDINGIDIRRISCKVLNEIYTKLWDKYPNDVVLNSSSYQYDEGEEYNDICNNE